jgi:hypothetical protein
MVATLGQPCGDDDVRVVITGRIPWASACAPRLCVQLVRQPVLVSACVTALLID